MGVLEVGERIALRRGPGAIDWSDLRPGIRTAERLDALPLVAVVEGPRLGSLTRDLLAGLVGASPSTPGEADGARLAGRIDTVLRFGLAPAGGLRELLIGGSQLVIGAGLPVGPGFAAWVRLLRTGVV